jgi:hypothetical protein
MQRFWPALLGGGFIALQGIVWGALHAAGMPVAEENAAMENVQVACLLVATVLFVWAAVRCPLREGCLFYLSLGMLALNFKLREMELGETNAPAWLVWALDGRPRDVWLGSLWLVLFVLFLRQPRAIWGQFTLWVRRPAGWLMIAGGVSYALSWPLDKSLVQLTSENLMFLEECADSLATAFILFSAVATFRTSQRTPSHQEGEKR